MVGGEANILTGLVNLSTIMKFVLVSNLKSSKSHTMDFLLYSITSLMLMPVHVIGFLFLSCQNRVKTRQAVGERREAGHEMKEQERMEEKSGGSHGDSLKEFLYFLTYPVNRYISNSGMYIFYLLVLGFLIVHVDDYDETTNVNLIIEVVIFIMSLGFVVPDIKSWWRLRSSWWPVFNSLGLSVVLVSLCCRFISRIVCGPKECVIFAEIQNCLFCFGIIMMVLRTFFYLAMSRQLGIIAISLISVGEDIILALIWLDFPCSSISRSGISMSAIL